MNASSEQHHHQDISSQALENTFVCTKAQQEKKPRPPEEALKCPRCESTNTKFCYYNNYSLSQPRYFCKSCRRYWTKGGTLRNVPVGGGCRKSKRSSPSSSKGSQDHPLTTKHNPFSTLTPLSFESSELTVALARLQSQTIGQSGFGHVIESSGVNPSFATPLFLDAVRSGFLEAPNDLYNNLHFGIIDNGNMGHVENGRMGANVAEEMAISYEDMSGTATTTEMAVPTVKTREYFCNGREDENKVLWGFPRQVGIDGNIGDLASGIKGWNGFGSSLWHGLINSPLMYM